MTRSLGSRSGKRPARRSGRRLVSAWFVAVFLAIGTATALLIYVAYRLGQVAG
jgi:hypothetical protein